MKQPTMTRIALLALLVTGSIATSVPGVARAEGLTCGRAYVEQPALDPEGIARVIHNCTGSGTVQYTVSCTLGQDFIFTQVYREPGFSIRRAVECAGGSYGNVSWKIV